MAIAILRVAALALVFGTGIPTLFALGMRAQTGDPIYDENGILVGDKEASTQWKVLGLTVYAVLAAVILIAILWVAKESIAYYTGWKPFGTLQ